jgi:hypothetical protein
MNAIVYNIFTKEIIVTESCLGLPSGLPQELIDLICRYPAKKDYILKCQDENLPNYVGYCTQYTGNDVDRSEFPFPCPNYKANNTILGLGILNGKEADSFAHMDKKYKVTLNRLSEIKVIYTRSDLVAHDDYISQLNKNASITLIYSEIEKTDDTFTYKTDSKWGGCPSYSRRLKAFNKLKALGFKVKMINETQFKRILKAVDKINAVG